MAHFDMFCFRTTSQRSCVASPVRRASVVVPCGLFQLSDVGKIDVLPGGERTIGFALHIGVMIFVSVRDALHFTPQRKILANESVASSNASTASRLPGYKTPQPVSRCCQYNDRELSARFVCPTR